jgi:sialidase-1
MKLFAILIACLTGPTLFAAEPVKIDLFEAGAGGYETYRSPGVVATKKGTVLVYCEARKSAKSDWGWIDVMMRRSVDGGATFGPPRKIVEPPADAAKLSGVTINNPVAIADMQSGAVHLLYCVEYGRCFYMRSDDDGWTFSKPIEITAAFEELRPKFDWKVIATGPGHGVRLNGGRLLVPVWLALRQEHRPSCAATIYSDDDGRSWHAGDIVVTDSKETPNPSESEAVELADGRVMLNIRNESPRHRRLVSISKDGISGWSAPASDEALFDPICMASIIRVGDWLVFSNPAGDGKTKARKDLTIRTSGDNGKTWAVSRMLEEGIAGYSDLAVRPDESLLCFFECGGVDGRQSHTKSLRLAVIPQTRHPDGATATEGSAPK